MKILGEERSEHDQKAFTMCQASDILQLYQYAGNLIIDLSGVFFAPFESFLTFTIQ